MNPYALPVLVYVAFFLYCLLVHDLLVAEMKSSISLYSIIDRLEELILLLLNFN